MSISWKIDNLSDNLGNIWSMLAVSPQNNNDVSACCHRQNNTQNAVRAWRERVAITVLVLRVVRTTRRPHGVLQLLLYFLGNRNHPSTDGPVRKRVLPATGSLTVYSDFTAYTHTHTTTLLARLAPPTPYHCQCAFLHVLPSQVCHSFICCHCVKSIPRGSVTILRSACRKMHCVICKI